MKNNEQIDMRQTVSDFLRDNPTYLYDHPEILEELYLPHATGSAISLVERQVGRLRERNEELRTRLDVLSGQANENQQLLEKTQSLIIAVLGAQCLEQMVEVLYERMNRDFSVEFCSLTLLATAKKIGPSSARCASQAAAKREIASILKAKVLCGVVRDRERNFLFGEQGSAIGSIAAVVIQHKRPLAVLSVGHRDANHYTSETGTLFLSYLGNVLNHVIDRFLNDSGTTGH